MKKVEVIRKHKSVIGEGAIWDYKYNRLLWVDILGKYLYLYYPEIDKEVRYEVIGDVGTVAPYTENKVILAIDTSFYIFDMIKNKYELIVDLNLNDNIVRTNDGKCGPDGRFYCGTMNRNGKGNDNFLYRVNKDNSIDRIISGIGIANGLSWSMDNSKFYYVDSLSREVWEYDYDIESGNISNKKVCIKKDETNDVFDGMNIDINDNLWIARYDSGRVTAHNPKTGEKIEEIKLPAIKITSCAFGGENLDELYVTSATEGMNDFDELQGGLFRIKLKVKGQKANYFKQTID